MAHKVKKELQNSLDLTDEELENYIPQLLQGLWELGSMPDYITELINRNITTAFSHVTDFGCGKGSVLIRLAGKFDFNGLGIDIIPEFIGSAKKYAEQYGVADKLQFKTEDLVQTIRTIKNQDIVIYGYDSEILGDLKSTLNQLTSCIKDDAYVILEFMFSNSSVEATNILTEQEMINTINKSDCRLIDRVNWDMRKLKEVNHRNNSLIEQNVKTLISRHPDKTVLFENYFQNQLDECDEIESYFTCTTLLLSKKN